MVVDPSQNCPARQVGAAEITGNLYDQAALRELAKRSDVITVEIEHLDTLVLEALEKEGAVIHPAPATVRLIQDKYLQKVFLREHSVPVADFEVNSTQDAEKIPPSIRRQNAPQNPSRCVRRPWQHGREQPGRYQNAEVFDGKALYAERFVPFERELAVMVGRSTSGGCAGLPGGTDNTRAKHLRRSSVARTSFKDGRTNAPTPSPSPLPTSLKVPACTA